MSREREQLEAAIAAMEAQRGLLPEAVVESMLAPTRALLEALDRAEPEPVQRLRQVTILFLDAVGSTPLSLQLDPEEVGAVLDDALARGTAVVERHHGRVLQYAGDGLLAAFGVDESREDDAERAVRCALDLRDLGQTVAREVLAAHDHRGFGMRVGVHTGSVLLGGGVDADGTIRGSAVNIAARMEQTAPAGSVRISHETYAQVRDLFDVDAQPPLVVKGVDEPITSYLVVAARPRRFRTARRGIEGVATGMVGRADELAMLQDAFRTVVAERRLQAVTVVAEAGVGKSRLSSEFEASLHEDAAPVHAFRGRADPRTQGQPYGLLRDVVAWRFGIGDDDTLAIARRKMESGIVPLFIAGDGPELAEGHAHLLGHLIGIDWRDSPHIHGIVDDPRQIRDRAFHAAAQLLRRVAAADGRPVVLQLEDLHWSDHASLDFLTYLIDVVRNSPILIVASTRPVLFERRTDWWAGDFHRRIDLAPLDAARSRQLVDALLRRLPEERVDLREMIARVSEGNPFYMEEIVRMLIDQRAIETGPVWRVDGARLLTTRIPATLTGVLQARLDGIDARERATLQTASVIGPVFWDRALMTLDEEARGTLPKLVARGLARDRGDPLGDDLREYAFQHALLHQVTYETVLKKVRRVLHGRLGRWFAAQTGLRANDFLAVAAGHFEEAGDAANAAEFYARAAEQAQQRMAHDAVHAAVERGLGQIRSVPEDRQGSVHWRLIVAREAALNMQGNRDAQRADLATLARLADERDDASRAYAALRRSYFAMRTGDPAAMLDDGRRAAAWAESAGDVIVRLKALRQVAFGTADLGDPDGGRRLANEVLAEAQARGLDEIVASAHNAIAVIADMQGDLLGALAAAEAALAADRRSRNVQNEAIDRANVGAGWLLLGNVDRVREESEEGLRLLRANGDRAMECVPLCNLSKIARWQGNDADAAELARTALAIAASVRAAHLEVIAALRVGDAELARGEPVAAHSAFMRAGTVAREIDSPLRHDADAGLARCALSVGDPVAAREVIDVVVGLDPASASTTDALNGTDDPRWIELTCWRVLTAAGDERADAWLCRAHAALDEQAQRIVDAGVRAGFLSNIPEHREILAAWRHRMDGPPSPASQVHR